MAEPAATSGPIVVGVDGSDASVEALHWAVRQAALTGATLRVITVWDFPQHPTPFGIVPPLPLPSDPLEDVRTMLGALLRPILERHPSLGVETEVVTGNPASILLDAASAADLLVVGSRGRGALSGALLGSVSSHCVHHASCPVVVVHDDEP